MYLSPSLADCEPRWCHGDGQMQPTLNPIDPTSGLSASRMSQRRVGVLMGVQVPEERRLLGQGSPPRLPMCGSPPVPSPGLCRQDLQPHPGVFSSGTKKNTAFNNQAGSDGDTFRRSRDTEELRRGCKVGVAGGPRKARLGVVVAPSVSMGKSAEVFRPPEKLRLGWGESCWPMTCDPRRGKTKPQAGWEL